MQGVQGQCHLHPRQGTVLVQGVQGRLHLHPRQEKVSMQGVQGRLHLHPRPAKILMQGVQGTGVKGAGAGTGAPPALSLAPAPSPPGRRRLAPRLVRVSSQDAHGDFAATAAAGEERGTARAAAAAEARCARSKSSLLPLPLILLPPLLGSSRWSSPGAPRGSGSCAPPTGRACRVQSRLQGGNEAGGARQLQEQAQRS